MKTRVKSEDSPAYSATTSAALKAVDDNVIARALEILSARIKTGPALCSPEDVKNYLRLKIGAEQREVFCVLLLDAQHKVIDFAELFAGTLTQTSVYPREVVKAALAANAAAVVLTHNHPSGLTTPSRADEFLTQTLKSALALIDVKVLDHIIVSASGSTSFAELGLL